MPRRRRIPVPHREFFRAVTIDETVVLACTCPRGVDHWYAEPQTITGPTEAVETADDTEPGADAADARATHDA
ncbi:hypothetical protein MUN74_12620 [Agromyces endophyticus]|uniref:hypothetical protein n=1 Tax=Agromyces sp. H17E-10 TaxID=2932244 RepID=UPI001FCFFB76|nr:hypothetical protein [Agromyces sp. H17E-10]UOQ88129.1 hypothetical protein MUN74_12620 [Agromyces sp. H17E-10]